MSQLAFDQVSVRKAGGYNLISAKEFVAIPLQERVQLIGSGKVAFYLAGEPVRAIDALKSLRAAA